MKRAARQCEESDAMDSKWKNKYEAEQSKSSRLQKELDDANSTLEKLRAEMNNGSKQKADKDGALQKQLAGASSQSTDASSRLLSVHRSADFSWCRAHKGIEDFARSARSFERETDRSRRRDEAGATAHSALCLLCPSLADSHTLTHNAYHLYLL